MIAEKSVTLQKDWDYQPKIGSTLGHHIKREREHMVLVDFLTRKNEGALLLCGERGVGKTSTLFSAINEANVDNSLISILIKATSIQFGEDPKKDIVEQFIRSLYNTIKNINISKNLKDKTAELYNKSTASKFESEGKTSKSTTIERGFNVKINLILSLIIAISGIMLFLPELIPTWILYLTIIVGGGWLSINLTYTIHQTSSNLASQYYKHDFDFPTMQSEFEELLNNFSKEYKIIFILDELDKTENPLTYIKNLKMLINQGNTHFVFITDPKPLGQIKNTGSLESTLFAQHLFLKRPSFNEMEKFIDEIIADVDFDTSDSIYKDFKKFLLYKSHTHFFDLYNVIRDHISKVTKENPVLTIHIDDERITKANLQKSIEWIYERKELPHSSQWEENDKVLAILYQVSDALENSPRNGNITFENSTLKLPNDSINLGNFYTQSTIKDFISFLVPQGYLQKSNDTTFVILGELKEFNPKPGGIFIEEQKVFIEQYEQLMNFVVNAANLLNDYSTEKLGKIFSFESINAKWNDIRTRLGGHFTLDTYLPHRDMYNNLTRDSSSYFLSQELQTKTSELKTAYTNLQNQTIVILGIILPLHVTNLVVTNSIGDTHSNPILQKLGLPNQSIFNTGLEFQGEIKRKIQTIIILSTPTLEFLNNIRDSGKLIESLIICISPENQSKSYENTSFIFHSIDDFSEKIKSSSNVEKNSNYFINITVPINFDELEKLFDLLNHEIMLIEDSQNDDSA